jgi:hypothetical protein
VQQTQNDYLFKIVKGGYYGHPNPLRGQYVLNGGNPTSSIDPAEVPTYPVGTLPDANYRGYAFNFQNNKSPDGVIEYKSNKFNGALKGKILVVRYSQNKDIIVLTPGGVDNNIISSTEGPSIEGFSGFEDPLDLVEDPANGNIYMSEYGGSGRITLLRAPVAQDTVAVPPAPVRDSTIKTFKIFPNPAQNLFHISFPKSYTGTYHLQLIDPTGRQYDLKKIILNGTAVKVDVDISYVPVTQGIYFLRISSDKEKSEIFKIVIHR